MNKFEELKSMYEGELLTDIDYDVIDETEFIIIIDNGMSGKYFSLHWWTAQEVVGENEVINEFNFYTE
jgi:hypothetical protein